MEQPNEIVGRWFPLSFWVHFHVVYPFVSLGYISAFTRMSSGRWQAIFRILTLLWWKLRSRVMSWPSPVLGHWNKADLLKNIHVCLSFNHKSKEHKASSWLKTGSSFLECNLRGIPKSYVQIHVSSFNTSTVVGTTLGALRPPRTWTSPVSVTPAPLELLPKLALEPVNRSWRRNGSSKSVTRIETWKTAREYYIIPFKIKHGEIHLCKIIYI